MTSQAIPYHRLSNQGLLSPKFKSSGELVSYMGCMQAQDYYGAKWAIGMRLKGVTDDLIENDLNEGKILRTHVLRPTWHFVAPEDIRWMLKLSAPKIRMLSKGLHRQLEIDETILKKSKKIIEKSLEGGNHLTREGIKANLAKGKINTDDTRLGLLLMEAEIDGLICNGKRQGKQFTYALLDERVPFAPLLERDAAIVELSRRYFISRGPATVQDFMWWSGLSLKDVKKSIEVNTKVLDHVLIDGQIYWFGADMVLKTKKTKTVHMLPSYDEYTVGYRDRSHVIQSDFMKATGNGIFKSTLVVDGQVSGIWKRTESRKEMNVEITPLIAKKQISMSMMKDITKMYAFFYGKEKHSVVIS